MFEREEYRLRCPGCGAVYGLATPARRAALERHEDILTSRERVSPPARSLPIEVEGHLVLCRTASGITAWIRHIPCGFEGHAEDAGHPHT